MCVVCVCVFVCVYVCVCLCACVCVCVWRIIRAKVYPSTAACGAQWMSGVLYMYKHDIVRSYY